MKQTREQEALYRILNEFAGISVLDLSKAETNVILHALSGLGEKRIVPSNQHGEVDFQMYNVFVRSFYKNGKPYLGRKTFLAKKVPELDAIRLCKVYNSTHKLGRRSRKAEFSHVYQSGFHKN